MSDILCTLNDDINEARYSLYSKSFQGLHVAWRISANGPADCSGGLSIGLCRLWCWNHVRQGALLQRERNQGRAEESKSLGFIES